MVSSRPTDSEARSSSYEPEQSGFLELVRAAGSDEAGPVLEFGLPVPHALRQAEGPHLLADDFRVEERFRFKGHLFSGRLCRDGEKPSVFLLGTQRGRAASSSGSDREPSRFAAATRARRRQKVQHPSPFRPAANRDGSRSGTSNIERRTSNIQSRKAGQSHPKPPQSHIVGIY